jgi:hypothetical protein
MSDPERLFRSGTEREKRLLGAARRYSPSNRARETTLAALGLGATVSTAGAASFFAGWGGKALIVGVGVLVSAGAVTVARKPSASTVSAPPVSSVDRPTAPRALPSAPATEANEPAPTAPSASALARAELVPTVESPHEPSRSPPELVRPPTPSATISAVAATVSPTPSAAPSQRSAPELAPSLTEAIRALDEARAQLRAGNAARAVSILDTHEAELSRTPLGPQAEVVRIESLVAIGDRAKAASRARAFLAAHPSGVLAARVRQLVPEANERP